MARARRVRRQTYAMQVCRLTRTGRPTPQGRNAPSQRSGWHPEPGRRHHGDTSAGRDSNCSAGRDYFRPFFGGFWSGAWVKTEAASRLLSAAVGFLSPDSTCAASRATGFDVLSFRAIFLPRVRFVGVRKKPHRPRDVNQLAVHVGRLATHQIEDEPLPSAARRKRGESRAAKLTAERRSEIARQAARARWEKK